LLYFYNSQNAYISATARLWLKIIVASALMFLKKLVERHAVLVFKFLFLVQTSFFWFNVLGKVSQNYLTQEG